MENNNSQLHDYMISHTNEMTDEWLSSRDTAGSLMYSPDAPEEVVNRLREQNGLTVVAVSKVFLDSENVFNEYIENWASEVGKDRANSSVPIFEVIHHVKVFRDIYWKQVKNYFLEHQKDAHLEEIFHWSSRVNSAFDTIIEKFSEHYYRATLDMLVSQQALIQELSSPVIPISDDIGVLPLIGDIDTRRAKIILESTLNQCIQKQVKHLFIDLSGVIIIDTMVAQQIFQVIAALRIVGVKTTLSGLRPEVAQIATQLGVNFKDVDIQNNLARALRKLGFNHS
ncbi:hypothetical protein CVD25_06335 [Bacillus canaveralius]|uniref:STAS domain-containing protein n=1 Tax=Bacillus canaveralius TaxID=1403243 RepID=A0A2N5GQH9_9BACI|nr:MULTISPECIES: STAS domain-containing protein [Bacillus]PLR85336.1 hypothetical protein CU635_04210 [Bacillus canaveralius]PLR87876.1 hypothetical protein CVD23_00005 [Bacillus sp. V33-4]PLR99344.1 hypothetical protein CVD25_06335 [Bacillus canaveralius]RSK48596.1 STAS domain-containing protein [Bacillus canaveralius]